MANVLVTVDLKNGTPKETRDEFYSILDEAGWKKIEGLTTAWEMTIDKSFIRASVDLEKTLKAAIEKTHSEANYAFSIGRADSPVIKKIEY